MLVLHDQADAFKFNPQKEYAKIKTLRGCTISYRLIETISNGSEVEVNLKYSPRITFINLNVKITNSSVTELSLREGSLLILSNNFEKYRQETMSMNGDKKLFFAECM